MSYIKRLKLKGFKSFSNPTVLSFETGFNTIVGANGSGKSNVFDALCFVLGRMSSKGLRADKLGNLVFNGGKNLKPSKEAEVSIYLSNTNKELMDNDLQEIKISRVVKNTGQSQYLLNNQKVTRTEIVEVLRNGQIDPDGYNIILQGDIMRIVNMTPVERRELIEEISDISGYEDQRQKSLKKLDKVEEGLKEADLLMEEKTKYLKELKAEKEQAQKYSKVKDSLRFNSLLLIKSKIIRNKQIKDKKEEDLKSNEEELSKYKEKLNEFETKSKAIEEEISKIEKEIEIKSHNDFISVTNTITAMESQLSNLKEKRAENKKNIEELKIKNKAVKADIENNKLKINQLEIEISDFEKKRKKIDDELKFYESKIMEIRKNVSSDSFKELDEIDNSIDELNEKKQNKNHIRQDNSIQIEKLSTKLEHLQEDLNRIEGQSANNKEDFKTLEDNREKLKKFIIEISKEANNNSELAAKLNNLQREYSALIEDHSKLKMKAEASRDVIATNKAVSTISKLKSKDSNIHGTVSELASVPAKYSLALETCAGKSLFNIVVESDSTAVKYINYLKDNKVGNATFLPLNKVKAKYRLDDSVLNKKGVIDYALNLIKFDPRYENIFHLIFADTIVIERIEDAKNIGIGDYRMVTLDGDIVAKSGAMSGGFKSRTNGLGAFKDDKVIERLEAMDSKVYSLKSSIDLLKSQKDESEKNIYDLRQEKIEIEGEVGKLEKLLSIEGRDTTSIKAEIENILSDKVVIESSLKKSDRDIAQLNEEIAQLMEKKSQLKVISSGHADIMEQITAFETKKDEVKERLLAINSEIDRREIQISNVLKPEIRNLEKILLDGNDADKKITLAIEEIKSKVDKIEKELLEYKAKEKELSKDYKSYIEKRDKLKEEKLKLEEKYEVQFTKFDKVKEINAQLRFSISEFDSMFENLNFELESYYNSIKAEFVTINEEDGSEVGMENVEKIIDEVEETLKTRTIEVKELQNKVNNLKTQLNYFGSINMKAVEIYDKLNEEFNELLDKRESLNVDKAEILEFVAQMDEKKKIKFLKTFEQLEKNFIEIFSKLSNKGDAELNLEDENDIFNTGVEIKVRLSKKNYLDIKSLSGGEKTITAIAFIFAVQEFNPASFYIFDEVDAALDIMNSEKLGKLIKTSSHKAQYVVVSHSEHLIQSAETIYGVTMDKNKISGIVSLDLRNMKEYVDEGEAKVEN